MSEAAGWWKELSTTELCEEGLRRFRELPLEGKSALATKFSKAQRLAFKAAQKQGGRVMPVGTHQRQRSTELINACTCGDAAHVTAILQAGADVTACNGYGQTSLFMAAWQGHADVVELLLAFGAEADTCSASGVSACASAYAHDHAAVVAALQPDAGAAPPAPPEASSAAPPHVDLAAASFTWLIPHDVSHAGAGSWCVDGSFSAPFLARVEAAYGRCADAAAAGVDHNPNRHFRAGDPDRRFFCDEEGFVTAALEAVLAWVRERACGVAMDVPRSAVPFMRFLSYTEPAQQLPAHVDASKWDIRNERRGHRGERSTHTFMLHLRDCAVGGGTHLLEPTDTEARAPTATVTPVRGRLVVFPHKCLHAGAVTESVPMILLRGELF